ncbi:hypothetical protein E8E11_010663 [Didymella keratinophila]|nr:hypothetical protein E8E11_010663 [Didymella keratinophila]
MSDYDISMQLQGSVEPASDLRCKSLLIATAIIPPDTIIVQYAAGTRYCHLRQQHTTEEQVSNGLDDPEDGKTDLIAPDARQLRLYGTSSTSPATAPGAVCDLVKASRQNESFEETDGTETSTTVEEQQRCLNLCIALLDQKLHGKLTGIMVGFLAALSIDKECNGFNGPVSYTPKLSALVKIAQLLLAQHAVMQSKAGHTRFPNELIAEMQDRFLQSTRLRCQAARLYNMLRLCRVVGQWADAVLQITRVDYERLEVVPSRPDA